MDAEDGDVEVGAVEASVEEAVSDASNDRMRRGMQDEIDQECNLVDNNQHRTPSDEDSQIEEANDGRKRGRVCLRCICRNRCIYAWPRTCSLFLGVVLPLWLLILISYVCGYGLGIIEAPGEIAQNNAELAANYQVLKSQTIFQAVAVQLPQLCLQWYLQALQDDVKLEFDSIKSLITDYFVSNRTSAPMDPDLTQLQEVNVTDLTYFMEECGNASGSLNEMLWERALAAFEESPGAVTFNWIRCTPLSTGLSGGYHKVPNSMLRPQAQKQFYITTWQNDRLTLLDQYYQSFLLDGLDPVEAQIKAGEIATSNATGGGSCEINIYASAWFWFTVTSTVGYGNQAPETYAGRGMVFTLGFVSILAFGVILATAGYIVSAVFEDSLSRFGLAPLAHPRMESLLWGLFYYLWMVLIAAYTSTWKEERLGETYSFEAMYWFAYISTTSVGLGDIYLEPEVIIAQDLIVFPLLFLTGFTCLAAFLGKLAEAIAYTMGNQGRPFLSSLIEERLKRTHILFGCGTGHES